MLVCWRGCTGTGADLIEWGSLDVQTSGLPQDGPDLYILYMYLPVPQAVTGVNGYDILRLESISTVLIF